MQVALFLPCYIDQLYPDVGFATVQLLEQFGVEVNFPAAQTCCGQPMANAGCTDQTRPLANKFFDIFRDYEYIVCPSGSCTAMVRLHYDEYLAGRPGFEELKGKTYELCEFLTDVLKVETLEVKFPHRVGYHQSCHSLRELRLGVASELVVASDHQADHEGDNKTRRLLEMVEGLELVALERSDECCGFGGAFAVGEEAVSCMMGQDRIADHQQAGAEVIVANDMSCLMHMDGLIRRQHQHLPVMHIAELLAGKKLPIDAEAQL